MFYILRGACLLHPLKTIHKFKKNTWKLITVVNKLTKHYIPTQVVECFFSLAALHSVQFLLAAHVPSTYHSAQCCAQPCSFSVPHPLPSLLLRQYIISCLLNTWRQSQRGNYWGHSHVCTQPSLTDRTSFRAEKRPCCCKGRRRESSVDWWSAPNMSNMIQQMSLSQELIKPGICRCFFIRHRTWRCAKTSDEGGLSPTLNHKGAGIQARGTHTNTHTTSNDLFASPATKNRKRFWGEPASETPKKPHKRLQSPDLCVFMCVCMGHVCLWVCAHASKECTVCVGYTCAIKHVFMCAHVASQSYTRLYICVCVLSRCYGTAQSSVAAWVAVSAKRMEEKFFLTSTPHFLLPDVTDEPVQLTHVMTRNACVTGWQDSGTSQKSLLISKNKLGWLLFILDILDMFAHIKNWDPSWTLVVTA